MKNECDRCRQLYGQRNGWAVVAIGFALAFYGAMFFH